MVSPTEVLGGVKGRAELMLQVAHASFTRTPLLASSDQLCTRRRLRNSPPLTETRLGENQGTCIAPRLDAPWQKPGLPERLENQRRAAG